MRHSYKRQAGMTGLGWLIVLALIGFFAMLGMKIGPIYLEDFSVKSTLESLKTEPLITKKSPAEVRDLIKRRFNINYVTVVKMDQIKIKKEGGILKVSVEYEVRKPMVGNLDVVAAFNHAIEIVGS